MEDLKALLIQNLPDLGRYALHLTRSSTEAEDLVQDCIERALRKSALFQVGSNYRAWLFAIMHNLFMNKTRRQRIASRHLADLTQSAPRNAPAPQLANLLLSRTLRAMASLTREEREALMLLGTQQVTYRELADQSGAPIGTVKSRVGRSRARLRRIVLGSEPEEPLGL